MSVHVDSLQPLQGKLRLCWGRLVQTTRSANYNGRPCDTATAQKSLQPSRVGSRDGKGCETKELAAFEGGKQR